MYASTADGLDHDTVIGLEVFAIYAAVAAANAAKHDQGIQLAAQMQDAMRTRAVIEQAKGILMAAGSWASRRAVTKGVAPNPRAATPART